MENKNAELREDYLKFLEKIVGKKASIEMCEKTNVTATIKAFQPSSEHVIVENLTTPIGIVDKAVIRATDVVKMEIDAGQS